VVKTRTLAACIRCYHLPDTCGVFTNKVLVFRAFSALRNCRTSFRWASPIAGIFRTFSAMRKFAIFIKRFYTGMTSFWKDVIPQFTLLIHKHVHYYRSQTGTVRLLFFYPPQSDGGRQTASCLSYSIPLYMSSFFMRAVMVAGFMYLSCSMGLSILSAPS